MTKAKASRLGKGLNSLLAPPSMPVEVSSGAVRELADVASDGPKASHGKRALNQSGGSSSVPEGAALVEGVHYLGVEQISPNRQQPRQDFDDSALESLAESIKRDGLMQPIIVRRLSSGANGEGQGANKAEKGANGGGIRYELVAGERRWRAAQRAGLTSIPALLRDLDEQQSAEWALIENLQREDLNPIERAEAFQRLGENHGLSHDAIADRVGLDRSTVTNLLRLLNLAPGVRDLVRRNLLSMGHSRALAGLQDHERQVKLAEQALREGWSVRQIEAEVRSAGQNASGSARSKPAAKEKAAYLIDLEKQIGEQLSTKVQIKAARKKGQGTLSIDFYSIDQFDELLAKLGVETE